MKRLFYPPPIRLLLMAFMLLFAGNTFLFAEGSIDFRNYPGHRLFYNVEQNQQLKVYAAAGEFINVGSSHLGINGGTIEVYNPNGMLVATFGGTDDIGIIFNDVQELNGPTGTAGGGYIPGVVPVGDAGVWSIRLRYPDTEQRGFVSELLNSDPWTREEDQPNASILDQRVALAWDVTVTQGGAGDNGGTGITGRLYSNEYISILDSNGRSTSPTFYILTRFGYLYRVDFSDTDPWGFPLNSNNLGLVSGDQAPIYMSANIGADVSVGNTEGNFTRSDDPSTWVVEENYLFEPQSEDTENISNNKIYFNMPDVNMPTAALVTDLNTNNTHTTWLFNEVPEFIADEKPFTFLGILPENGPCNGELVAEEGAGGYFVFNTDLAGQATFRVDVNNNGSFEDAVDITVADNVGLGIDSIFWDGRDGAGNIVAANPNFEFAFDLTIRGGEVHLLLADIENNLGGVNFTNPLITNIPFTYDNNFGDQILLDQWAFIETNSFGTGTLAINIESECAPGDHDNDGVPDVVDIDDDNDGVPDLLEYCHPTEGFACLPNGLDPSGDADSDGVLNFEDANDPAVNNGCADTNGDGVCDQIAAIYDTDGDNVPDHLDLDSDNDGISDLVEAGHNQADVDGNGVIDGDNAAFGANGLFVNLETNDGQDAVANYVPWDVDGDGIPDHDDLDSDNDGIADVVEAGYASADSDQDGRIDDGNGNVPNVNIDGLVPLIDPAITGTGIPLPIDWDNDGVPDWHDLDSDNDGILDVIEGGYQGNDTNGDGRIDDGNGNIPAVNSDGLPPVIDPAITGTGIILPPDTDGDNVPDWHDLDSDNDGINDTVENNNPDGDGDGFIGTGPITVDVDGVAIADNNGNLTPSIPLVNTDGEGPADFRDLDSDGDGINDVIEGGSNDPDGDGIIGTGTPTVNPFGQSTDGTTSNPPDTDGDGTPDFQQVEEVIEVELCDIPDTPTLAASGTNLCEGDDFTLTATGITDTDVTYVWTATGATGVAEFTTSVPMLPLSQLAVSSTGTYTVVATRDTCVSAVSNSINIVVNPRPVAPTLTASATSACEGASITLNAGAATTNTTYQWILTRADGTSAVVATTDNPNLPLNPLTLADAGTYTVEAIGGGGACPSGVSNGVAISVSTTPAVPTLTANATSACEGASITLNAGAATANTTYEWTLTTADGTSTVVATTSIPELPLNSIVSGQAGTYTVEAIGGGICPSGASNGVAIEVFTGAPAPVITASATSVCEGASITLDAGAATANTTYEWTLTMADGTSTVVATTNNPNLPLNSLTSGQAGTYTVVALAGGGACPSVASNGVTINVISVSAAPVITASATSACEGESINLNAGAGSANTTYQWTLTTADGTSTVVATTDNPNLPLNPLTVADAGTYTVEAIGGDGACTSGVSNGVTISIAERPAVPTLTTSTTMACEGESVTLDAGLATANTIYQWTLTTADGTSTVVATTDIPSFQLNPITANQAGTYTVEALGNGTCASGASNAVVIEVMPVPSELVLTASEANVCEGAAVVLSATPDAGPNAIYEWTLVAEDGSSSVVATTNEPIFNLDPIAANQSGTYTVEVVDPNGVCPSGLSNGVTVMVTPMPDAPVLTVDKAIHCEGDTLTFTASTVEGTNVIYEFTFTNPAGRVDPLVTRPTPFAMINGLVAANTGTYQVRAVVDGCPSEFSNDVPVDVASGGLPNAMATSSAPNGNAVCEGEDVMLSVVPDVDTALYEWAGPNGIVGNMAEIVLEGVTPEDVGEYNVTITINGCPNTVGPVTVDVAARPATPMITADTESVCPGEGVTLTTTAITGDDISYDWILNGMVVTTTTEPTFTVGNFQEANAGDYTVVVSEGGCPSEPSEPVAVALRESLEGVTASSNSPVCIGEPINLTVTDVEGATFEWTGPNGFSSMEQNPSIDNATETEAGDYTVVVTVDGCPASIPPATVVVTPRPDAPTVSISEGPVCEGMAASITVMDPQPNTTYTVTDAAGNTVASSGEGTIEIPTDGAAGDNTYTVVAQEDGGCPSEPSNAVNLTVTPIPDEEAMILTDPVSGDVCGSPQTMLEAVAPAQGTGMWTSSNPNVVFTDVNNPTTAVAGLADGDVVTWTLSNEACGEYASTSITISAVQPIVTANPDVNTILNTETATGNVATNDTPSDGTVTVISGPSNGVGTIDANGNYTYTPNDLFEGTDQIVYEICNAACPDVPCAQSTLTITVNQDPNNLACIVPDVISPNNDGLNDVFVIGCSDFQPVALQIFNRWGDLVFESDNYDNSWTGTHDGNDLPPGPYYYIFEENGVEAQTGCVTIAR